MNLKAIGVAALIAAMPASAMATAGTGTGTGTGTTDTTYQQEERGNDFPWGLLGLLGLAGLLGRKRRDDHVHVDRTGTNR